MNKNELKKGDIVRIFDLKEPHNFTPYKIDYIRDNTAFVCKVDEPKTCHHIPFKKLERILL